MPRKQPSKKLDAFNSVYVIVNKDDHQMIWACEGEAPTDIMEDEACLKYNFAGVHNVPTYQEPEND